MRWQLFNVEDSLAELRKNRLHSQEGKIGEMFVVNSVELILLN